MDELERRAVFRRDTVCVSERRGQLHTNLDDGAGLEGFSGGATPIDDLRERDSVDELHRQKEFSMVTDACVIERDDVGMLQPSEYSGFVEEHANQLGVVETIASQTLERYPTGNSCQRTFARACVCH